MTVQLIWGCNPAKQFEQAWVQSLLQPSLIHRDGTVGEIGLLRLGALLRLNGFSNSTNFAGGFLRWKADLSLWSI